MAETRHGETRRKPDTRSRIQEIALELFAEQGYEKTSLREIAERLGVTKAALYYHFKTKDDIVASLFEDFLGHVDAIVEWARAQTIDDEVRKEIVRRYAVILEGPGQALIQFVQGNQSAVRDLKDSKGLFERLRVITGLLAKDDAPLTARLKSSMALGMLHIGYFGPFELNATAEERRAAALEVALELIDG
jgi:AcrR family transcriptional regulator